MISKELLSEVINIKIEDIIDMSFYTTLVDKAVDTINKHTDIEWFLSDDVIPWKTECGKDTCVGCNHLLKTLTLFYWLKTHQYPFDH